uniref:ACT domain-containing protein n=1 Tax=Ascaris lumbricoides TaxID=6252 RepID=A0A0M3IS44_ASCLU
MIQPSNFHYSIFIEVENPIDGQIKTLQRCIGPSILRNVQCTTIFSLDRRYYWNGGIADEI